MERLHIEGMPVGPLQTNCYIIWSEASKDCWIIDPGGFSSEIISKLKGLSVKPTMLIITHGHWDHFLGAKGIKKQFPQCKVAIHREDSKAIADPERNGSLMFLGKAIIFPRPDILLDGGERLSLDGAVFDVIHTPGHSPGSISLYSESCLALFCGDLIFAGGGIGRTDLAGGSYELLKESIRKILTFPDNTVIYPGHGPTSRIEAERPFLLSLP